jgi:hypothetical protein
MNATILLHPLAVLLSLIHLESTSVCSSLSSSAGSKHGRRWAGSAATTTWAAPHRRHTFTPPFTPGNDQYYNNAKTPDSNILALTHSLLLYSLLGIIVMIHTYPF